MPYDYSKLLGRMKECGFTQEKLAKTIGKNKSSLNAKLNGKSDFTAKEISFICEALNISNYEIVDYFFCK